jgi:hypothetical protein
MPHNRPRRRRKSEKTMIFLFLINDILNISQVAITHEDAIGSAQVRAPRGGLLPSPEHCG